MFVCYSIAFVHCTTINKSRLFAKQCKCFVYTCIVDATDVHLQTGSPQHGSQRLYVILLDIVQKHQLVREPDSFGFLLFRILLGVKTCTTAHCKHTLDVLDSFKSHKQVRFSWNVFLQIANTTTAVEYSFDNSVLSSHQLPPMAHNVAIKYECSAYLVFLSEPLQTKNHLNFSP